MPIARELCRAFSAQCSRWHDDRVTLVFQLFASHAGRQEKSGRKFLPARARVNLQKSLSPVSPCHPEAGYLRCKSQLLAIRKLVTCDTKVCYLRYESLLLAIRKSVTCDTKVSYLRPVIHWLTTRITSVNSFKIKQAMEILASGRREWWGYSHHRNQWYASSMWNQPLGRAIL